MSGVTVLPLLKRHPLADFYAKEQLVSSMDQSDQCLVIPKPENREVGDGDAQQYLVDTYGREHVVIGAHSWYERRTKPTYLVLKGDVLPVFTGLSGVLTVGDISGDLEAENPDWPNQVLSYTEQNPGQEYYIDNSMIYGLEHARDDRYTEPCYLRGGIVLDRSWIIKRINETSYSLAYNPAEVLRKEREAAARAAHPRKKYVKQRAPTRTDIQCTREYLLYVLFSCKLLKDICIRLRYDKYSPLEQDIKDSRTIFKRVRALKLPFWRNKLLMRQVAYVHERITGYKYKETPERCIVLFHNLIEQIMKEAVRRGYKPDKEE